MTSSTNLRRLLVGIVAAALFAAAGFVWGYFAHRDRIFPYGFIRQSFRPRLRVEARAQESPALAMLRSLPYVGSAPAENPEERGVTLNRDEAFDGLNFYCSQAANAYRAYLIDMKGNIVHAWRFRLPPERKHSPVWRNGELLPNGDVISVLNDESLIRVNARSDIVWETKLAVHHDLWPAGDGLIYALSHRRVSEPAIHPTLPILADFITVLNDDGKVLREISLLDALEQSPYSYLMPRLGGVPLPQEAQEIDLFHANHVERVDGRVRDSSALYAPGNLLVSMRHLNAIAILDSATGRIIWLWGPGNLTAQHHPRFLRNGNILVFDNGSANSQVVEVDPRTNEVRWRYAPKRGFFSPSRGANQRLPNGNTLITESDRGTVFEITPDGTMVWRFVNPDVDSKGERTIISRMTRYTREELPFLKP